MKEKIQNLIANALPDLNLKASDVHVEHPENFDQGDFSTNIALTKAKELKINPIELAEKIVETLSTHKPEEIDKIEVAGPGFINFFLKQEVFIKGIKEILETGEEFGKGNHAKGLKTIIEYTDPNPFKEFHIGHLMPNVIGESLSRIIEWNGAEVKRANYQGDVGLHVAKAVWGLTQKGEGKPSEEATLQEKVYFLGQAYAHGAEKYETEEEAKKEIQEFNRKIFTRSDPEINALYDWGRQISLDYFEGIYEKLGTKFDFYFFENEMADEGVRIVMEFATKGIFEESDGAMIFKGEKFDPKLHTRVFVNSQGLPTYEAKELALAKMKFDKYPYNFSVVVTANEINDYFRVLLAAMKMVFPDLAEKTKHISHGVLRLVGGKMSSRKGNVISADSLITGVSNVVREKMQDREINEEDKEKIVLEVSIAAIKFSILKQAVGRDIIFDFEKSISFEGDSGPYLQYAHTRAASVLKKGEKEGLKVDPSTELRASTDETSVLERLLVRFPEIVERAGKDLMPSGIVTYLIELSAAFNSYYAEHQIVGEGEKTPYRLALTKAFAIVMKNGLHLLGIKVPEKM